MKRFIRRRSYQRGCCMNARLSSLIIVILLSAFLSITNTVAASPTLCWANVHHVGTTTNNSKVFVRVTVPGALESQTLLLLCRLTTKSNLVSPEVCRAWLSIAMASKTAGRQILLALDDVLYPTCDSLGDWQDISDGVKHIRMGDRPAG